MYLLTFLINSLDAPIDDDDNEDDDDDANQQLFYQVGVYTPQRRVPSFSIYGFFFKNGFERFTIHKTPQQKYNHIWN